MGTGVVIEAFMSLLLNCESVLIHTTAMGASFPFLVAVFVSLLSLASESSVENHR